MPVRPPSSTTATAPRSRMYAGESLTDILRPPESAPAEQSTSPTAVPEPVKPTAAPSPTTPAPTPASAVTRPTAPAAPEEQRATRERVAAPNQATVSALQARVPTRDASATVTVKPGDTLTAIAARSIGPDGQPLTVSELIAHNPHLAANPDLIHPGDVVRIPRSTGATVAPAALKPSSPAAPAAASVPESASPPAAPSRAAPPPAAPSSLESPAAPAAPTASTRTATQNALFAQIAALGPEAANPGNVYEQAIVGNTTAEGLQRFVDGALQTLERRSGDAQALSTWTRNIRVALGRAAELGVSLR